MMSSGCRGCALPECVHASTRGPHGCNTARHLPKGGRTRRRSMMIKAQAGGTEGDTNGNSASENPSDTVEEIIADEGASQHYMESMHDSGEDELDTMYQAALPYQQDPMVDRPLTGWVLAMSVLVAARLGRSAAEAQRFDISHLQAEVEEAWRAKSVQLRRSRLEDEGAARAAEQRMQGAQQRAAQQQRERQQRDAALQVAAERERQKAQAAASAERAAFEAQEARMAAELEQRTQQERRLLEEAAQRARQAAEERRREAEAAAAAAEAERQRAEEEARRQAEEARAAKEAEKRELRRLERKFTVRLLGRAEVARPDKGTMTQERLPKEATVQVAMTLGTSVGGEAGQVRCLFSSIDRAQEGLPELAGSASAAAVQLFESTARVQAMTGQGVLQHMSEVELAHWLRVAAARGGFAAAAEAEQLLQKFPNKPQALHHKVEVRTERGVLPEDHPERVATRLGLAISAVERADSSAATSILEAYMDDEEDRIVKDVGAWMPAHVGEALAVAHFLDQMYSERPARQMEASPWYEAAGSLARKLLHQRLRPAPKDSLASMARLLGAVLGPRHAVTAMLAEAAEANMSSATRSTLQERERIQQAELAAALLEEEWPDQRQAAAARAAAREAATPVPERVWALRNVGATLALGGPGERARARQMLEKAALLKAEWVGSQRHPSVLPELDALGALLEANEEWQQDASGVRSRMLVILGAVADRYEAQGQKASACALLEAAMSQYEEVIGLKSSAVKSAFRRAEQLLASLPDDERETVASARRQKPSFLDQVVKAFNEEPAVQITGEVRSKASIWDEGGLAPLPLL